MRTKILIFLTLIGLLIQGAAAQENKVIYSAWIEFIADQKPVKGYLKDLKDSAVVVADKKTTSISTYHITAIKRLSFRNKKKLKNSMLVGGISTGVVSGIILAAGSGDNKSAFAPSPSPSSLFIGMFILTAPIGVGIGALVGSSKVHFEINGEQGNYDKEALREFLIKE